MGVHATQHGTGWRADSMGDLGSFSPTWNPMYNAYTPNTKRLLAELAALKPKTLAAMHGSTFVGDGEKALLDLGPLLKELLGS